MIQNTCKLEGGSIVCWDNRVDADSTVLFYGNFIDTLAFENQIQSNKFETFHVLATDLPGHGHSFLQEYTIIYELNRLRAQGIIKNLVNVKFCGHSPYLEKWEKFNPCLSAFYKH